MNAVAKSTVGMSLAGIVVLLAMYGAAFWSALEAGWLFLLKLADTAPLGLTSFLMALEMAIAVQPFLRKWVAPHVHCQDSRDFLVESAALAVGVLVMWAQTRSLQGLLLGLLAGLLAPYLLKGITATLLLAYRAYVGERDPDA